MRAQLGPMTVDGRPRSAARCSAASSAPRSARSPPRCSRPATSACRSARPARPRWSRPTSPPTARAWRSPRTRSGSTSPCARPPTSGSSATCRGCAGTCSPRSRPTPPASASTARRSRRRWAGSTRCNPESMQELIAIEGIFTPEDTPAAAGRAGPAGDRARAGRGLGLPRRRPRRRRPPARRGPARRDVPPPPGGRRAGRADLRRAGRPGAAPAPAARGRPRCGPRSPSTAGVAGRDALWGHPDLLPAEEDFADPDGVRPLPARPEFGKLQPRRGGRPSARVTATRRRRAGRSVDRVEPGPVARLTAPALNRARVASQPPGAGRAAESAAPRSRCQPASRPRRRAGSGRATIVARGRVEVDVGQPVRGRAAGRDARAAPAVAQPGRPPPAGWSAAGAAWR